MSVKKFKRNPLAKYQEQIVNEEEKYYEVTVQCRNCGVATALYFKKGLSVYMHRCPKCEVQFLGSTVIK